MEPHKARVAVYHGLSTYAKDGVIGKGEAQHLHTNALCTSQDRLGQETEGLGKYPSTCSIVMAASCPVSKAPDDAQGRHRWQRTRGKEKYIS